MSDLLIINPGAAHGIYGALGDNLVAVEPPLWARLIAGYVQDRGHSVAILDAEAMRASPSDVAAAYVAAADKPKLICITVYGHQPSASTQQMSGASAIASALREEGINTPIIMVGGHVSALPARTLVEEQIDFACVGEGPVTVADLLTLIKDENCPYGLGDITGLVWFNGTEVRINKTAPLLDLKQLHGAAWDLLPMNLYRAHNWQMFGRMKDRNEPYASIYTSLGCPYKCLFCCINAPFQTNRYRMRDPVEVVQEILHLYRHFRVRTFKIVDEMFVLNEKHYTAICEGLIASGVAGDLNIWAYARVDTVKPETLAMLRKAGIRWLALGIESGSAYVREGAQKRLKSDDILNVVRVIQAADINVIGNYIFGLPDDDMSSMEDTLTLALELNTEFANFYSAMAYPGSPLYTEALAQGWTLPTSWAGYSQHNAQSTPLATKHLPARDVLAFRDAAFNMYFTNPDYLDMVLNKFGRETVDHVLQMTTYRLKRDLLQAA